jgi:ketosteroid isomerase-like protein
MSFTGPVEDRLAIRELLDAYADAVCTVDADAWGATWVEDSEWDLPEIPEVGKITGHANIVAAWKAAMAQFPGMIFTATPGSIRVEGERAWVRSYTSEVYDKDGVTQRERGRYDDVLVKRSGRWLFKKRTFRNIHRGR